MHEAITAENIRKITDPSFRKHAMLYIEIEEEFREKVESFGLGFSSDSFLSPLDPWVDALAARGLAVENDRKSLHVGWISPSCVRCRKGVGAATFQISNQCPRSCFFCFNRGQVDYERLLVEMDRPVERLLQCHDAGVAFKDLALSGGEPLMHIPEVVGYFSTIRKLYPDAYTRLYTSGAFFDEGVADLLAATGLDEIRFSVKTDDPPEAIDALLGLIEMAKSKIPAVMVEMPVMPDELELMKGLLVRLDGIGIDGINLLELGFPCRNAEEFARRGYSLKPRPFRTLYGYSNAAGLPVAGSEETCLRLLEFAMNRGLGMGVHYCSLENKNTAQVYLQNIGRKKDFPFCEFSERDFFLKSVKAYGKGVEAVEGFLKARKLGNYRRDIVEDLIEFPPSYVPLMREAFPELQMGLSYHVVESERETYLLELRVDLITPETFDLGVDV